VKVPHCPSAGSVRVSVPRVFTWPGAEARLVAVGGANPVTLGTLTLTEPADGQWGTFTRPALLRERRAAPQPHDVGAVAAGGVDDRVGRREEAADAPGDGPAGRDAPVLRIGADGRLAFAPGSSVPEAVAVTNGSFEGLALGVVAVAVEDHALLAGDQRQALEAAVGHRHRLGDGRAGSEGEAPVGRRYGADGSPTGALVDGSEDGVGGAGSPVTWADLEANAAKLGIALTQADMLDAPVLRIGADGRLGRREEAADAPGDGPAGRVRRGVVAVAVEDHALLAGDQRQALEPRRWR
jgi:hypothetical protein